MCSVLTHQPHRSWETIQTRRADIKDLPRTKRYFPLELPLVDIMSIMWFHAWYKTRLAEFKFQRDIFHKNLFHACLKDFALLEFLKIWFSNPWDLEQEKIERMFYMNNEYTLRSLKAWKKTFLLEIFGTKICPNPVLLGTTAIRVSGNFRVPSKHFPTTFLLAFAFWSSL